jgi:hypothetical protein
MTAALTPSSVVNISPYQDMKAMVIYYTKSNSDDTIDMKNYGMKTVRFAVPILIAGTGSSAGYLDPPTLATSVITLSVGTGTAMALVVGSS